MSCPSLVAAGYATAPPAPADAAAFFDALLREGALEIPVHASGLLAATPEAEVALLAALARAPAPRRHVVTLVPGTMARLGSDPHFGLASDDAKGRAAALAHARLACAAVARVAAAAGSGVAAVELQSAPTVSEGGPARASAASLRASLEELAALEWSGAVLCVEHCDDRHGPAPLKGFLVFGEELLAVSAAATHLPPTAAPVGVSLNWARSVLEKRDVAQPLAHIAAAGPLLRGLMFSGCSGAPKHEGYGVWKDAHLPADAFESGSLLTYDRISESLRAAATAGARLAFCGVKVTLQPASADVAARIAVNCEMLGVVARSLLGEGR